MNLSHLVESDVKKGRFTHNIIIIIIILSSPSSWCCSATKSCLDILAPQRLSSDLSPNPLASFSSTMVRLLFLIN